MNDTLTLPAATSLPGSAAFLEAHAGPERTALLDDWLAEARGAGYTTLRLSAEVEQHGVWAGLAQLLESLLPRVRRAAPNLVHKHAYELCVVLPALRREIEVTNPCLTDTANDEEKVRNYANDRAYRTLHGIIEFLDAYATEVEPAPGWAIACDAFDHATSLVQRFFGELVRRRGAKLKLALLLAVEPEHQATRFFDHAQRLRLAIPAGQSDAPVSPEAAARLAEELERRVGDDRIEWSIHIPRLIWLWQHSPTPERADVWLVRALGVYNHDGLYEVAVRYAPAVEAHLERMRATAPWLHAHAVMSLFFSYAALGRADDALRLVEHEGLPKITQLEVLCDLHYDMGMLYARFLKQRDYARAEAHLAAAQALVPQLDVAEARRHFLGVFIRNGLAYVRFRQGRASEALDLCASGLRELDATLPPAQHRLHRSVLLYNAAQVLAALDRTDDAIDTLSRAMQMDPNYSEYYLDRGNLWLKLEHFSDAEQDFLRAIELSPPYPEVWTNLGQCYRAAGRYAEAEDAYSRALDLDPTVSLALVGRAEARFECGELAAALADYSEALRLDPHQPLVLAARAVVHFELSQPTLALSDLDQAIQLAPDIPELHENRAIALHALGLAA